MTFLSRHPLFQTLSELKGNSRIIVLTEVLFGIPFNMYMPFFSVYMKQIGLSDQQIGGLASVGLILQVITSLLSGAIVDKFGRRLVLMITDLVSWGLACIVWAVAEDVRYFVVAVVLNSTWRIAHTAWTCLMVEDTEERHLVHIWTWIMIFSVVSALLTPVGGYFVNRYGLIPAERGILIFGSFMFSLKSILLFFNSHETKRGIQRQIETQHQSIIKLLGEYKGVLTEIWQSRAILSALSLMVITNIYRTVTDTFWGILFTTRLGFSDAEISIYVAMRSLIMTSAFFLLGPKLTNIKNFKLPLWLGFLLIFISQGLLVLMPAHAIGLLIVSVVIEGLGSALVSPMTESLLSISMETHERARVTSIVYVMLLVLISPFGWIAGQLSAIDRTLPFVLNMVLFFLGGGLIWYISRPGFIPEIKRD